MENNTDKNSELVHWFKSLSNDTLIQIASIIKVLISRLEVKMGNKRLREVIILDEKDFKKAGSSRNEFLDILKQLSKIFSIKFLPSSYEYTLVRDMVGVSSKETSVEIDVNTRVFEVLNFVLAEVEKMVTTKKTVSFNEDKSVLYFNKKEIAFRRYSEQYHTLRIIFQDKDEAGKQWFYSEIAEKLDSAKSYKDKDFHNYLSAIKRRVSAETGIKDLFLTTNQSVRINPDYLKSE